LETKSRRDDTIIARRFNAGKGARKYTGVPVARLKRWQTSGFQAFLRDAVRIGPSVPASELAGYSHRSLGDRGSLGACRMGPPPFENRERSGSPSPSVRRSVFLRFRSRLLVTVAGITLGLSLEIIPQVRVIRRKLGLNKVLY